LTAIEIFHESEKQTHEDLFLDNASRRKNLKDMKGFDMAICSVDSYAWLSCKGQNNKKTQSLLQDKKSTANYPYTWLVFFETSKCEQHRKVVLRTPMPPCCPIVAPEKQALHHGTGHSSSPATTGIGHNVAHFLETHGDFPGMLIQRNSLKAHPFMKHYVTPNIHKQKTY